MTFVSVSFLSTSVLFICSLMYILTIFSIQVHSACFQSAVCCLYYLNPEVNFLDYRDVHHISLGYDASSLCHHNLIASPIMVIQFMFNYCSASTVLCLLISPLQLILQARERLTYLCLCLIGNTCFLMQHGYSHHYNTFSKSQQ